MLEMAIKMFGNDQQKTFDRIELKQWIKTTTRDAKCQPHHQMRAYVYVISTEKKDGKNPKELTIA